MLCVSEVTRDSVELERKGKKEEEKKGADTHMDF